MTAYFGTSISSFVSTTSAEIEQQLLRSDSVSGFTQVSHDQLAAWRVQIKVLQEFAQRVLMEIPKQATCGVVFEYRLPRREKRLDAVVLLRRSIIVIEFKAGARSISHDAMDQVVEYALDLAYYHAESRTRQIIPLLCPTEMSGQQVVPLGDATPFQELLCTGKTELPDMLIELARADADVINEPIDHRQWTSSAYTPIPGILDATVALFSKQRVRDITKTLAERETIRRVVDTINCVISKAHAKNEKVLCLVTGVPGAGKTLVGLQIVHSQDLAETDWKTVFLSGNGPLLRVLKEALTRDYHKAQECTLLVARNHAAALLHSVHSFLLESLQRAAAPSERVIVFDEAQRAWDAKKMDKMAGKQRRAGGMNAASETSKGVGSEPTQILTVLDRHIGGAVLVALCGNGQEIHDGEAGVAEWITARDEGFSEWQIICSPVAATLANLPHLHPGTIVEHGLHLEVSMRSHRATGHAQWVDAVLSGDCSMAASHIDFESFPIVVTRELEAARQWLKRNTLGSRRKGLLASSGASRLRAYGIEVAAEFRKGIDYAAWFTSPKGELRSSHALEVVATEFECQGLELDRVGVCWCWDLLLSPDQVVPRTFHGAKWKIVKPGRDYQYVINKYRVLLTRAREGMVIWVPKGDDDDSTRSVSEAEQITDFLLQCGARLIT